jgi:hypothetical protein
VDNHFGEYWKLLLIDQLVGDPAVSNDHSISVYPNPASNQIQVSATGESNRLVQIYSSLGQIVRSVKLDQSGNSNIDVSDLKKGIYLFKIGTFNEKILIAR